MARNQKRSNSRTGALSAALILGVIAGPALAQEAQAPIRDGIQFGARLGADYSDNYLRSATDEVDATIGIVGVEVGGSHTSGRFKVSAFGDAEYQRPVDDNLETDVVGRMAVASDLQIIPDNLELMAAGLFTQVRPDLFRPESVENREDVLSWAVGPVARLRMGSAMSARIETRYTNSDYSLRALDNETAGGQIVLGHDGARENFIGIGAGYYDVSYKEKIDPSAVDYTRQEAFARLLANGTRTRISLDVGYEKVEGDEGENSGPLIRANIARRLSPSLEGFIAYVNEFPVSDRPTIVGQLPVIPDDESVLTAAPRRTKFGSLGFSFTRPRTQADIAYMHSFEDGVLGTLGERTWQALRGNFTRNLTANSLASLYAIHTREELRGLSPTPVKADENTYGAEFEWLFGRKLSLVVYSQFKDRESQLITDRYDELTGGIFVRYGRVDTTAVEGGATAPIGR